MPVNKGYEVQIDDAHDDYYVTGVLDSLTTAQGRPPVDPGEWNTMEITLDGPRTVVVLSGVLVTDYTEGDPVPPVGLQNHSDRNVVYFKEVELKELGLRAIQ